MADSQQQIIERLTPIITHCRGLDLNDPRAAEASLEAAFPFASPDVQALRALCAEGLAAGWLCDRGEPGMQFSRVAKPDGDLRPVSVDAVLMSGAGPRHRHPRGEVDLCFTWDGEPRFDGRPPGWVVFPEDSTHTPTVTGGTMLILYILPGGAIEWVKH